jgi:hypothetical protein
MQETQKTTSHTLPTCSVDRPLTGHIRTSVPNLGHSSNCLYKQWENRSENCSWSTRKKQLQELKGMTSWAILRTKNFTRAQRTQDLPVSASQGSNLINTSKKKRRPEPNGLWELRCVCGNSRNSRQVLRVLRVLRVESSHGWLRWLGPPRGSGLSVRRWRRWPSALHNFTTNIHKPWQIMNRSWQIHSCHYSCQVFQVFCQVFCGVMFENVSCLQ